MNLMMATTQYLKVWFNKENKLYFELIAITWKVFLYYITFIKAEHALQTITLNFIKLWLIFGYKF